jgi:Fe-S-cluster-containing dehydrogenase component
MSQLGWKLDLGKCTGCGSCTIACKAENKTNPVLSPMSLTGAGYPDHVSYRWVIHRENGTFPDVRVDFVSMSCNHCADPACMKSCPVDAISKRDDGIVLIDNEKCVGCKYCIFACPYGAPQYNSTTRKVEKCTFCAHRIDKGLEPACVTTCLGRTLSKVDNFNSSESGVNAPEGFSQKRHTNPCIKFVSK